MQRADFEKNVQQKMQELRFHPSDEVWKRVESGIAPKKRRRPVLWILFAALILGGAGYFVATNENNNTIAVNKTVQPGQSIAGKQNEKDQQVEKSNATEKVSASSENTVSSTDDEQSITATKDPAKNPEFSGRNQSVPTQTKKNTKPVSDEMENSDLHYPTHTDNLFPLNKGMRSTTPIQQVNDRAIVFGFEGGRLNNGGLQNNLQLSSPSGETSPKKSNQSVKKTNWQFGLTASVGISDVGEQLLKSASAANFSYDSLSVAVGGAVSRKPSEVKNGAAFSIGGYASKSIGKNWKLGMGLSYQYLSNTIKVGERVDSMVVVNQSNVAMDRVNKYYKSTGNNSYHNQYHFISVPVYMQWQFAKRFTWENAIVGSKLVKTNALHFDGVSGRYYENKNLFNEFQLSATTAVLFGFNKNKIQVGPQIQYAFTNLLNSDSRNSKHLRAASIKANIELWKR